MMILDKRVFSVVAMFALLLNASAQASEIEDDILIYSAHTNIDPNEAAYPENLPEIPYNISQVAVYLRNLLNDDGLVDANVVFEDSVEIGALFETYVDPDNEYLMSNVTAGYRYVILLDDLDYTLKFPELAFEGAYQLSKKILRSGSTPLLLMTASANNTEMTTIRENSHRIANGCGMHLISAGSAANAALKSSDADALNDDRTSYLVACMIYTQITGKRVDPMSYVPEDTSDVMISNATELADLAYSTQAEESVTAQYDLDVGNTGAIRYNTINVTDEFSDWVRYLFVGSSTERGLSARLQQVIAKNFQVHEIKLSNSQELRQMDLDNNASTLEEYKDQAAFIYTRWPQVTADKVRSAHQAKIVPIICDRPPNLRYGKQPNMDRGLQWPLRNYTWPWMKTYYSEFHEYDGWNLITLNVAMGRLYEHNPLLLATNDDVHMSEPLYWLAVSQMLSSTLGQKLVPPDDLTGDSLAAYNIGHEYIKQVAHLSENGAFTPDSRLRVIEPTPHLAEPGVFYRLQLEFVTDTPRDYSWEVDPGAPLPDGLSLSSSGLISGTPTEYFNSQVVVVKVTDAAGAFRKVHLTLFTLLNPIPVAEPDAAITARGRPVSIDVLANDVDADAYPSPLSIVSVSSPSWGSAEIVAGKIVYTPQANLSSQDSFTYTITDGENFATGSIEVLHHAYIWIPLDEDTGSSTYDAYGTTVGTMLQFTDVETAHVEGKYGNALTFDGRDDRVLLNTLQPLPLGSSPRTLMCWMRTPAAVPPEGQGLIGYGQKTGGQRFLLRLENPNEDAVQRLALDIHGAILIGPTNLADNQWHHVAVVCDDLNDNGSLTIGECRLYVDGELEASVMTDPTRANKVVNTVPLNNSPVIGGASVSGQFNFRGAIDDVRIFPEVLTADEVAAYANGMADAAARWHLDQFGHAYVRWTADDDGDQLNRLYEYALGGDPSVADASDFGYEFTFNPESKKLEVSFNRRKSDTHGLKYIVEASSDLIDWETLITREIASETHSSLSGFDRVTFETGDESLPQQFFRLRIVE